MSVLRETLTDWWRRRADNGASDYLFCAVIIGIALIVGLFVLSGKGMDTEAFLIALAKIGIVGATVALLLRWVVPPALMEVIKVAAIVAVSLAVPVGLMGLLPKPTIPPPPPAPALVHLSTNSAELLGYRLGDPLTVPECKFVQDTLQLSYLGPDGAPCFRHRANDLIGKPMELNEMVVVDRLDLERFQVFSTAMPVCIALREGRIEAVSMYVLTKSISEDKRDVVKRSLTATFAKPSANKRWILVEYRDPAKDPYYERDVWTSTGVISRLYSMVVPSVGRNHGYIHGVLVVESANGTHPFFGKEMDFRFDCPVIGPDQQDDAR
ncbi:hypothetical protein PAQ31011_01101 [Pandoraea aquatica]|uniref:Transmembrane protein n=1 Tax=Pandoraea aquatica TaxID=2508290 RepID=A0A5E4T074_9BURK|nr:hypothetical protein [Pandoraea aquatica]VVD80423.1 hypothetical protein PAQ31011_01101 [Pandoraea aquatica]